MDKNYYEILDVDRNASPEIIEKAYKTLAKKYHPDLQDDIHKKQAEETFKKINEAYETLSNPEQKALYDKKLEDTIITQDKYNQMYQQNQILKNKLNNLQQHMYQENISSQNKNQNDNTGSTQNVNQNPQAEQYRQNLQYEQQLNQARQKAYYDAYINSLKNRGYKIRYKKTFKDYVKNFLAILVTIVILLLLFQIPFIKNFFINLYNDNILIRSFVDIYRYN